MVDVINYSRPVQRMQYDVNSTLPAAQRDREMDLQNRAGIELSNDYLGTRSRVASELEEDALSDLYTASEGALMSGADPKVVSDFISKYTPDVTASDVDIALEMAAAKRQTEESLADNPVTATNNYVDNVDFTNDIAKQEMYTNFIESLKNYSKDMSLWKKIRGFGRTIIDPQIHQNLVEQGYLPKDFKERNFTNKNMAEALDKYFRDNWNKLSPKEYNLFLDSVKESIISNNPNPWMLDELIDTIEEGGNPWQDVIGFGEIAAIGAKILTKPFKAAKYAGDIAKLNKEAHKAAISANKADLAKEFITQTAAKPVQNLTEISSDSRVAEELAKLTGTQAAEDFVNAYRISGLYDEDDLKVLGNIVRKDVSKSFKKTSMDAVDVSVSELDDGTLRAISIIGSNEGKALTKRKAQNLAKKYGDKASVVKKDNEGYFVEITDDLTPDNKALRVFEHGNSIDPKEWSITGLGIFNSPANWLVKHFAGTVKIGSKAHARAVEADRVAQGLVSKFHNGYKKSFYALSADDKKDFFKLYVRGQYEDSGKGAWYTSEELDTLGVSEPVKKAYADFKVVSDIEYLAHNADVRTVLHRKGYRTYGKFIGKKEKVSNLNPNTDIVADLKGNIITDFKKFGDDATLIRVNRREANNFTHVIARAGELSEGDLPQFVTHYMPGGRRSYTRGTSYIKIGSGWYNPATGREVNGFAKTVCIGTDPKELQKAADFLNEISDIYKMSDGDDLRAAKMFEAVDDRYLGINSWEEAKKFIKTKDNPTGILDPKYKAQVLEHKQKYDYGNNLETIYDDFSDVDMALEELLDVRQNFYNGRGNILDTLNGEAAQLVDIEDIYDKTIRKASTTLAKADLLHWYNKELDKFRKVIANWSEIEKMSDLNKIVKAEVISAGRGDLKEADLRLLRSAERFLGHARRVVGARTVWDTKLENTMMRTAKVLDCFLPNSMRRGAAFQAVATFNPSKAARAIGFQNVMGWWNSAQFYKQGLGTVSAIAMEPVNGMVGLGLYPIVRLAMATRGTNKGMHKFYTGTIKRFAGLDDSGVNKLFEYLDKMGTRASSGLIVGADREVNYMKRAWDTQYMFMQEGNAANFYVADITAFLAKKDKSFREIAAYSDDLFINMTKSSESAFQAGQYLPTAALAQWKTYPTRMFEAMFNSRLTKTQRASLLGSQIALWGLAGTFGDDETALNMYIGLTKHGASPEVASAMTNGLLGAAAESLGVAFDEGLALKDQIPSIVEIFKGLSEGDATVLLPTDAAVFQAGQAGLAWVAAVKELVSPATGDRDMLRFAKYIATKKGLPSSVRNTTKGLLALRYKTFWDNNGAVVKDDVETYQAVAQMLGFGPYENKENTYKYLALAKREEVIEDALESLQPFIDAIRFNNIEEMDRESREKHLNKIQEEYDIVLKSIRESIIAAYPDGDTLRTFDKQLTKRLFGEVRDVTEDKTIKSIKGLGYGMTYMITRNKEKLYNGPDE